MATPHFIGVRHHSPACAKLVVASIEKLKPAFVLIEGPADFNGRLSELAMPHTLPIAIYSYLSGTIASADMDDNAREVHRGSWTPFAEHSPEWQALRVGREIGAQLRFIDLPAWHDVFADTLNRYADEDGGETSQGHEACGEDYVQSLMRTLRTDSRDALWDQLFEDQDDVDALGSTLHTHFQHLRNSDPGSIGNQAREAMMAQWIAWAVAQQRGPVLVICGGYHAPALERIWPQYAAEFSSDSAEPAVPQPPAAAIGLEGTESLLRYGSFIVPYTFKRLDAFTGYASGMPSPAYYQWLWQYGADGAARRLVQGVLTRLRDKKLPASTADLMALQVRAQGLAMLRGHRHTLRSDWLDALAGALVKDALDVPLPWSYRGPIRAGTDPILVEAMDVLAGDQAGRLAPDTPQPPLVQALRLELEAAGLQLSPYPVEIELDLLTGDGRMRSRLLHRAAILELPGFRRLRGPQLALSGERKEVWALSAPFAQLAALIEAGAWGATPLDAARAKLEDQLRKAGARIGVLAEGLNRAAFAGLHALSQAMLQDLQAAVAQATQFEELGSALDILFLLLRHGHALQMANAPVLKVVLEAGVDRALWLLEPPASVMPAQVSSHIKTYQALCQIAADVISRERAAAQDDVATIDPNISLDITVSRMLAVFARKASNVDSAPVSRGAALGANINLHARSHDLDTGAATLAMSMLASLTPAQLGDAVTGLLALAREDLAHDQQFVSGLDARIAAMDDVEFIIALPALRAAFAWLPTRERGELADKILALHNAEHMSRHALTAKLGDWSSETIAAHRLAEKDALVALAAWGIKLTEDA